MSDKKKPQPGLALQGLNLSYALLSLLANLFGSVFWWLEQRRWWLADQLENERRTP